MGHIRKHIQWHGAKERELRLLFRAAEVTTQIPAERRLSVSVYNKIL